HGDGRRARSRSIARQSAGWTATRDHLAPGELIARQSEQQRPSCSAEMRREGFAGTLFVTCRHGLRASEFGLVINSTDSRNQRPHFAERNYHLRSALMYGRRRSTRNIGMSKARVLGAASLVFSAASASAQVYSTPDYGYAEPVADLAVPADGY